ncbi:hypothetical protein [Myxococcus qinghaiensis]|uniref:hypothetical protein n=1 Tax=Myxococcus qinghaiensis TaxID=2906758 RepID=UPI0020A70860|nr:hypothetical protein [Myxococcus qinghaiensis]MCP3166639.1 hypothetical protein [Myxococcus qinghaiensis]
MGAKAGWVATVGVVTALGLAALLRQQLMAPRAGPPPDSAIPSTSVPGEPATRPAAPKPPPPRRSPPKAPPSLNGMGGLAEIRTELLTLNA